MSLTFSVVNFARFQHYKDRSPPWIKLYNETLDDYEFGLLPDASKAHLFAIWLLASRYDNKIPADAEWIARKVNATTIVDLTLLEKAGFITFNQPCSEPLAARKQDASPERETETQVEREKEIPHASPAGEIIVFPQPEPEPNIPSFLLREKKQNEPDRFAEFWAAYPLKRDKGHALKGWPKALKLASADQIIAAAKSYAAQRAGQDKQFTKYPEGWLSGQCWLDEVPSMNGCSASLPELQAQKARAEKLGIPTAKLDRAIDEIQRRSA